MSGRPAAEGSWLRAYLPTPTSCCKMHMLHCMQQGCLAAQLSHAGELKMSLVPWAAQKESECHCTTSQVIVESRQSRSVAELDFKHIESQLAGDLSAGYLALKFTGEQIDGLLTHSWRGG